MSVTQRRLGWRPDLPDVRDKLFAHHPAMDVLPLPAVDLREFCSPVRDQADLGSCTGFAHAEAVDMLNRLDASRLSTVYSSLWMYFQARKIEGTVEQDAGAFVRSGAKVLANIGIPPESRWPYRIDRFAQPPTPSAEREATRWKVGVYSRCRNLAEIKVALTQRFAVVGGFSCYSNMFDAEVDRTGDVPEPSGGLEGGHAVHFTGYDDSRSRLLFQNSWGPSWGNGGYGSLPYWFVQSGQADDFWAYQSESAETVWPRPKP